MSALLANYGVIIGVAVASVTTFNVIMTSVKKVLDKYAPTSKADSIFGKLAAWSGIAVEYLSANSSSLPAPAQEALTVQK